MLLALMLFANDAAKDGTDPGAGGGGSPFQNPLFLVLALGVMFVFIVLLPQQRREKKQREALMSAMKKNDEVVTASGIIGVVHSIKEGGDEVTLKIDDNAKMRVLRSSIVKILTKETKEGA